MQPVKRPSDRRRDGLGSDKRTPRLQVNPGRWHSHWRGFLLFLLVLVLVRILLPIISLNLLPPLLGLLLALLLLPVFSNYWVKETMTMSSVYQLVLVL